MVFGQGNIVYKETIAKPVEGVGHFEPLRHYAEAHLLLEPGEPGSGIEVASACSEDVLDLNWQRLIATHIMEREHPGVLTGSALTDVKITILSGRAHIKHTEGGDFRQATYRAIRQGLKSTESVLLEPVYAFTLEVPQEMVGRAMTDLKQRAGKFDSPEFLSGNMHGGAGDTATDYAVLHGTVPVATMQDYSSEVHAYTRGLGHLTLELSGYDVCHNSEEVTVKRIRQIRPDRYSVRTVPDLSCRGIRWMIICICRGSLCRRRKPRHLRTGAVMRPTGRVLARCTGSSLPARPAGS